MAGEKTAKSFSQSVRDMKAEHIRLVEDCAYETRLAVTAWVIDAIVRHAREGGSFRALIYHRLGFEPDAYVPLYLAGGMNISNEFIIHEFGESDNRKTAKALLDALWPGSGKTVTFEGGKEPWLTVVKAHETIMGLDAALTLERPIRTRIESEQAEFIERIYDALIDIRDNLADEGDRVYFGSTNDADRFRDLVGGIESEFWRLYMDNKINSDDPETPDE